MKFIYLSLLVTMFAFSSCSNSSSKEEITTETSAANEENTDETLLAEHKCDATCEKEGCTGPKCGEKGHECKGSCHKNHESEEGEATEEENH